VKVLVTGATGFIGRRLVLRLARENEVVAIARPGSALPGGEDVEWVEQDLTEPLRRDVFPARVDAVIHLAQSRLYKQFPEGAADVFEINVHSTFRLLEYAREVGASRFVFASTGGVYGSSDKAVAETDRLNPLNFYLSSKYGAESLVTSYDGFLTTVIFRFFFVYGPGQTQMMVPTLLGRVLRGEQIVVEGDPGLRMNPIHVDDATRVFEPALRLEQADLFNVAGAEAVTLTELVQLMAEVSGREAHLEHALATQPGDLVGDNSKMRTVLGVEPQKSLRDGLTAMVEAMAAAEGTG
jgi:nucleoside-diphosphate-sugar epimerase